MSFLVFREIENPGKKTKRWTIHSRQNLGVTIGWIEFHAPWRKYIWGMTPGSIFDVNCTNEVVEFLNQHKDDRQ